MSSTDHGDEQLRSAIRKAVWTQQLQKHRAIQTLSSGTHPVSKAQPSPEHYHVVYTVPKEEVDVPHFAEIHWSSKSAYQKIFDMAQQAEPNTEWYDDGSVAFETRLHGRADLWWLRLSVAACIRSSCRSQIARNNRKSSLIVLPGGR